MPKAFLVHSLTLEEQKQLMRVIRSGSNAPVVRCAQMVLLSSQDQTAQKIGALWQITDQGVRKILRRFSNEGIAGLADRPRQGRPRKANEFYFALLNEAVQVSPRDLGYPFS